MSLKRKLVAGGAALLVAGGAAGAGLAASGHDRAAPAPERLRLADTSRAAFLRATAEYLGTGVSTLRHERKAGRTLAQTANATPGRSEKQLAALLVAAASSRLRLTSDGALSRAKQQALRRLLRSRVTGFLNDACALGLGALEKHLAGCPGMA